MNGLASISEKILADAKQQADAIIAEAKQSAQIILADAKKHAESDAAAAMQESAARCLDAEEKARLASQLEGKKMVANARQQMITQAFDIALKRMLSLPVAEYRALLIKLANEVLSDGKGGELLLNARDYTAHGEALKAALPGVVLINAPAPIVGGLIIRRGKIEYNCALDVIVRMASEKLAPEVSSALFSKGA